MPWLDVGGTTVNAELDQATRDKEEVGDRARAFDGTMRSTIRARKRVWSIRTVPILRATANTLEGVLEGTPPIACSGDLIGATVNCHARITGWRGIRMATGEHVVLSFELHEA